MKKILFLLIIFSQGKAFAQVEISYLSGIGTTNIIPKTNMGVINTNYTEGLGFTMGCIAEYPIFKGHLYVKSGLFFSEKGALRSSNPYDSSLLGKRREDVYYVESPIQLQFKFFPMFKLQAGIYNAMRLNMFPNEYGGYDDSYAHYENRYDFGYIAGLNFGYKRFVFEVNFLKSIKRVGVESRWDSEQNKIVLSDDIRYYNQNLFFTLGYKLFTDQ